MSIVCNALLKTTVKCGFLRCRMKNPHLIILLESENRSSILCSFRKREKKEVGKIFKCYNSYPDHKFFHDGGDGKMWLSKLKTI